MGGEEVKSMLRQTLEVGGAEVESMLRRWDLMYCVGGLSGIKSR